MLYLASSSPRRQQLLQQIQLSFTQLSVEVDETPQAHESPSHLAQRLALSKALAAVAHAQQPWPILAADTVVAVGDSCLGKPKDRQQAIDMLSQLSARTHQVYTAIAVVQQQQQQVRYTKTEVTFRDIEADEIAAYCNTDEPWDKAGAYAIQGIGAIFIKSITGSFSGVVGLPLCETTQLLKKFGITPLKSGE